MITFGLVPPPTLSFPKQWKHFLNLKWFRPETFYVDILFLSIMKNIMDKNNGFLGNAEGEGGSSTVVSTLRSFELLVLTHRMLYVHFVGPTQDECICIGL